tara:strand:+ start:367 stop:531 length:165 start_codon:yes stop_codon:yes gene_type:complete
MIELLIFGVSFAGAFVASYVFTRWYHRNRRFDWNDPDLQLLLRKLKDQQERNSP